MKFTDLNFDCLETVLEYLELIDLLNVADSTKRLNKAAQLVFVRKHGNKTVGINGIRISRHRKIYIANENFYTRDLKTALQLLRCFGPVISKIKLKESSEENRHEMNEKVLTYINKYCADYLKELQIVQFCPEPSDWLKYFDRPFLKLTTFESRDVIFTENSCLNRLFPKMRCLDIMHACDNPNISFYNINTKHFPYLEERIIYESSGSFLRNEMMINLLQLNPQLKKLTIQSWDLGILNTDLIRSAVDSLKNVETLSLLLKPITFFDDDHNIIRMRSVKSFDIKFDDSDYWSLPFSFENLEKFRIDFSLIRFRNGSSNDQFYNFIDKHSSITNLSFQWIISFGVVDWSRLADSLPLLLEIEIFYCYISADEAMGIMVKFKMLKKFRFKYNDDFDNLRKNLDKNWDGTYDTLTKTVKLTRKM